MRLARDPDSTFTNYRGQRVEWHRGKVRVDGRPTRRDQRWFWTRFWQDGEGECQAELDAGLGRTFDFADDAIAWLYAPDETLAPVPASQDVGAE